MFPTLKYKFILNSNCVIYKIFTKQEPHNQLNFKDYKLLKNPEQELQPLLHELQLLQGLQVP